MVGVSRSLSLSDLFYMSLLHFVHRVRLKGMVEIKDAIKRNPYLLKYASNSTLVMIVKVIFQ